MSYECLSCDCERKKQTLTFRIFLKYKLFYKKLLSVFVLFILLATKNKSKSQNLRMVKNQHHIRSIHLKTGKPSR